mgnify:CR=1 FL=1
MDNIRQVSIQDGVDPTRKATVTPEKELKVSNRSMTELLEQILIELKINNFYNSITHNIKVTSDEVED